MRSKDFKLISTLIFSAVSLVAGGSCVPPSHDEVADNLSGAPTPAPGKLSWTESETALLRNGQASPVQLTSISRDKSNVYTVTVKILGTSKIVGLRIGISPPPECKKYSRSGDMIVDASVSTRARPDHEKNPEVEDFLLPGEPSNNYLAHEPYIRNCPPGHRKPVVYIWEVRLENGIQWSYRD